MAESFLCLMADLDEGVQKNMSEWYAEIKKAGFTGTQTPDLPYHISLATYPLEMEEEVLANVKKVAAEFSQVEVDLSHIGMFAGGRCFSRRRIEIRSWISFRKPVRWVCRSSMGLLRIPRS